jgi:hypothetical protein
MSSILFLRTRIPSSEGIEERHAHELQSDEAQIVERTTATGRRSAAPRPRTADTTSSSREPRTQAAIPNRQNHGTIEADEPGRKPRPRRQFARQSEILGETIVKRIERLRDTSPFPYAGFITIPTHPLLPESEEFPMINEDLTLIFDDAFKKYSNGEPLRGQYINQEGETNLEWGILKAQLENPIRIPIENNLSADLTTRYDLIVNGIVKGDKYSEWHLLTIMADEAVTVTESTFFQFDGTEYAHSIIRTDPLEEVVKDLQAYEQGIDPRRLRVGRVETGL